MEKDLTKKRCLSDNSRYADLINGAVFGGKQLLRPEDLSDLDPQTGIRKAVSARQRKRHRQQYQDLVRKAAFGVNFAIIGLEDQEEVLKEKLKALILSDPAFQEMDEDAYEMMAEYANMEELIGMKKYYGKDGKRNLCKGIQGMLEDSRAEGESIKLIKQVQLKPEKGSVKTE